VLSVCCLAVPVVSRSPDRETCLTEGLQESRETCGRTPWAGQETGPEPVTGPEPGACLQSREN